MLTFIEPESWEAFKEMRKKIRAPLTYYAETLIARELVKLKASGQDPQACLDQSIMNGWRDVFPLRDKGITRPAHEEFKKDAPQTAGEREASEKARRMAMAAIKGVLPSVRQ
jgi:hypothetical protein